MAKLNFPTQISISQIRALSAILAGEKSLPRRKDRDAEVKRFVALAERSKSIDAFIKLIDNKTGDYAKLSALAEKNAAKPTSVKPATPAAPATGKGRGRKSHFVGKVIHTKVDENPRHEGGHGHRSMSIIIKAGKKGIAYDDFIKAGGRSKDLAWDQARDRVELTDK